jgi:hypothetical protein
MAIMKTIESPMEYRNPNGNAEFQLAMSHFRNSLSFFLFFFWKPHCDSVFMGLPGLPEYSRLETDGEVVKQVVEMLAKM